MSFELLNRIWPVRIDAFPALDPRSAAPKDALGPMTPAIKSMAVALCSAANDQGLCWLAVISDNPGRPDALDLSTMTGLSDRAARSALTWLDFRNFIDRKPNGRGYTIIVHLTALVGNSCRARSADAADHNGPEQKLWSADAATRPADAATRPADAAAKSKDNRKSIQAPEASPPSPKRALAQPLTDAWKPTKLSDRLQQQTTHWSEDRFADVLDQFRAYALRHDRRERNWQGAWMNWVRKELQFEQQRSPQAGSNRTDQGSPGLAAGNVVRIANGGTSQNPLAAAIDRAGAARLGR